MNWAENILSVYHIGNNQAEIFGILIYNESNVEILKMLNDDDYWRGLDSASGPRWNVFALRTKRGRTSTPQLPPGVVSSMVPIWEEPEANEQLIRDLGIGSTRNLPILLTILGRTIDQAHCFQVRISGENPRESFRSLKHELSTVSKVLESVDTEQERTDIIFKEVLNALKLNREKRVLKKIFHFIKELI
ncbi:MAG: hypothetical protein AAGG50_14595 [Bacteroidota bacterium]